MPSGDDGGDVFDAAINVVFVEVTMYKYASPLHWYS
jgi:hypothetical protein